MDIINLGRLTNSYMIPINEKYILIDTGYDKGYAAFIKRLKKKHIDLNDIAYIFLTHAHDDHAGFLNELLRHTQAKVILHEKAVQGLRRGQNSFNGGCSGRLALMFCKFMAMLGKGEHRFAPVEPGYESRYIIVNENSKSNLENELPAKIIETPGHTGCSLSLLLNNGILFCGDAAMNGFPSRHRATIWIEDMSAFCDSWQKIIALKPKMIYPGHGQPFQAADLERFLPYVRKTVLLPLKSDAEQEATSINP